MKNLFKTLKNPQVLQKVLMGITVVLVIAIVFFLEKRAGRVAIDDSLVQAPIITLSPQGKLTEMDVYEGEYVKKGDPIAVVSGATQFADSDGLIVMANNQIGSAVGTQNPVAQMIRPESMRIAGTIDENKGLSDIRVGQVASFTVDALPGRTFWGYVDEISPTAKQTDLSFSISSERPTQQFVVYVKFDANQYPQIKNGMSAKMTVFTNSH